MDANEMIRTFVSGSSSIDDLRKWRSESLVAYTRPPVPPLSSSEATLRTFIEESSDWRVRAAALDRTLSNWMAVGEKSSQPAEQLHIYQAVTEIGAVLGETAIAGPSYLTGRALQRQHNDFDAIEYLERAHRGFRERGQDKDMDLQCLRWLTVAFLRAGNRQRALAICEELISDAKSSGLRIFEAIGLILQALILTSLGNDQALAKARNALELRREFNQKEEQDEAAEELGWFLLQLGRIARDFSRHDEALRAYEELRELASAAGREKDLALVLSEIGHLYYRSGERTRAQSFLQQAADLARKAGDPNAERWAAQAAALSQELRLSSRASKAENAEPEETIEPIHSSSDARRHAAQVESLMPQKQYRRAGALAEAVLEYALHNRDTDLQITILNSLGLIAYHQGELKTAIRYFHRGIGLTDKLRLWSPALVLRMNLAAAWVKMNRYEDALDVIDFGIAINLSLLDSAESTETRQQLSAGALPLFELLAGIITTSDAPNAAEYFIERTELARARNLLGWFRLADPAGANPSGKALALLQEYRSVEVELEVRSLSGELASADLLRLKQARDVLQKKIETVSSVPISPNHSSLVGDFSGLLSRVIARREVAVIALFSVAEGISVAVAWSKSGKRSACAKLIPWERTERIALVGDWADSLSAPAERSLPGLNWERGPLEDDKLKLRRVLNEYAARLFQPLSEILGECGTSDLLIIPQGELSVLPFWQLLGGSNPMGSFSVIPSLGLFELCDQRDRPLRGDTLLVSDATATLQTAEQELAFVRQARAGMACKSVSSFEQLHDAIPSVTLLHAAAHGLFYALNPYHSGILLQPTSTDSSVFTRYLTADGISQTMTEYCFRLATVAEIMARLRALACNLAIISACQSGVPRIHGAGEMTGVPTALLVAGARSVIASMWRVNDAAASVLMKYFYDCWAGGLGTEVSPARALARARSLLATSSQADIRRLLGLEIKLPDGEYPFADPIFTDAFMCVGAGW
jgi:CHAT domain-containing protein/tetratricopeptide (TPR) repeat protein